MKEKILSLLGGEREYVSGQALCTELGVSRTAVWKVINQLREDGYEIESVAGKGYRMISRPDCITAEEITSCLRTQWAARSVRYYETIDSTNNEAKRLAEQGAADGTLVVAEEQSQGKGRRGHSWMTPAGTAIAMSLLLRPSLPENSSDPANGNNLANGNAPVNGNAPANDNDPARRLHPDRAPMLTLVMGMAVAAACREVCGVDVGIKWPNDVVAEGKKICGILTEMSCEVDYINYVVIGIGINTGISHFPPELRETAISLHTLMGQKPDRARLIASCMEKFELYYDRFRKTQDYSFLMDEYNTLLVGKGVRVRVLSPGDEFEGVSEGIDQKGELLVRRDDGIVEAIFAGEVSVRGIYGYV
ncbi:MAG: biotin--[acetyl-CoA-carboxylase] ligase [Lachnospiraceae bacterium]|nr:biotin--[acetyl-CoA-carboxylase] ligase [Lachnospiraceae bacterium]